MQMITKLLEVELRSNCILVSHGFTWLTIKTLLLSQEFTQMCQKFMQVIYNYEAHLQEI